MADAVEHKGYDWKAGTVAIVCLVLGMVLDIGGGDPTTLYVLAVFNWVTARTS